MKTATERFVVTSSEKKLMWDTSKTLRLPFPSQSELVFQDGQGIIRDRVSRKIISEFNLSEISTQSPLVIDGTEVKIFRPRPTPSADRDFSQLKAANALTQDTSVFVYEGSDRHLHVFQEVKPQWLCDVFTIHLKNGQISISPRRPSILVKNKQSGLDTEVRVGENFFIDVKDLPHTEIQDGLRWWKFSAFMAPVLLDESEFDFLNAQEVKQDRLFQGFFAMGTAVAVALLFASHFLPKNSSIPEDKVIATTDITIDRSIIDQAKPIEVVHEKPVNLNTAPVTAPSTPVAEVVKPAEAPVPPKPEAKPIPVVVGDTRQTAPVKASTGKSAPAVANNSQQMLARHSKMLQDAFGGVLGLKGAATGAAPTQGKALANTPNPTAAGAGFFGGAAAAKAPQQNSDAANAVTGKLMQNSAANMNSFVKTTGATTQGGKGSYGKNVQISVAGQGSGASYDGAGLLRSGSSVKFAAISAVFSQHSGEIRTCYENTLSRRPDIHGKVSMTFDINPNGTTSNVSAESALTDKDERTTADPDLTDCMIKRVRAMTFPKPTDQKLLHVPAYPLEFKNIGEG